MKPSRVFYMVTGAVLLTAAIVTTPKLIVASIIGASVLLAIAMACDGEGN